MSTSHCLDGDALSIELFRYLCRLNRITDSGTLPFLVPDTVVFTNSRATQWFSFDPESGTLGRRPSKSLDRSVIFSEFSAQTKHDKSEIVACFTTFHDCRLQSLYFSEATLKAFLFGPGGGPSEELVALTSAPGGGGDGSGSGGAGSGSSGGSSAPRVGILQKFIEPNKDCNEVFQIAWSPRMTYILRRFSKRRLIDRLAEPLARAATFDGPSTLSDEVYTGPGTKAVIEPFVKALVDHVRGADSGRYTVGRCLLFFKVDRLGQMWFLYCTSMRIIVDDEDRNASMLLASGGGAFGARARGGDDDSGSDGDDNNIKDATTRSRGKKNGDKTAAGAASGKGGADPLGSADGEGEHREPVTSANIVSHSSQVPTLAQLERAQVVPHIDSPLAALMGLDEAKIGRLAQRVHDKIAQDQQAAATAQALQQQGANANIAIQDNAAALRSAYQIRKPGASFPKQTKDEEKYPVRMRAKWDRATLEKSKFTPPPVKPHLEPLILSLQRQENQSGLDLSEAWDGSEGGSTADHERLLYLLSLPGPLTKRELVRSRKIGQPGQPPPPGWEETREKMFPSKKKNSFALLARTPTPDAAGSGAAAAASASKEQQQQQQPEQHDQTEPTSPAGPVSRHDSMAPSSPGGGDAASATGATSSYHQHHQHGKNDGDGDHHNNSKYAHSPTSKHFRYARNEMRRALQHAKRVEESEASSPHHSQHDRRGRNSRSASNNAVGSSGGGGGSHNPSFHHRKVIAGEGISPQLLSRFLTPSLDSYVDQSERRIEAMEARKQELREEQERVRAEMRRSGMTRKTTTGGAHQHSPGSSSSSSRRHQPQRGHDASPITGRSASSRHDTERSSHHNHHEQQQQQQQQEENGAANNESDERIEAAGFADAAPAPPPPRATAQTEGSSSAAAAAANGAKEEEVAGDDHHHHHHGGGKSDSEEAGGDQHYEDDFEATPEKEQQQGQHPRIERSNSLQSQQSSSPLVTGALRGQRPAAVAASVEGGGSGSGSSPRSRSAHASLASTRAVDILGGHGGGGHIVVGSGHHPHHHSSKSVTLPPYTQFSDSFIVAMKLAAESAAGAANRDLRCADAAVSTVAEALQPKLVATRENVRLESKYAPQRVTREETLIEAHQRMAEDIRVPKDNAVWILDDRVVAGAFTAGVAISTHAAAVAAAEQRERQEKEEREAEAERLREEEERRKKYLALQAEQRVRRLKAQAEAEERKRNEEGEKRKRMVPVAMDGLPGEGQEVEEVETARGSGGDNGGGGGLFDGAATSAGDAAGADGDENAQQNEKNAAGEEEDEKNLPQQQQEAESEDGDDQEENAAADTSAIPSLASASFRSGSGSNVRSSPPRAVPVSEEEQFDQDGNPLPVHITLEVVDPLLSTPRCQAADGRLTLRRLRDEALSCFRHTLDEETKRFNDVTAFFNIVRADIGVAGGIVTPRTRAKNEKVQQQILVQQQLSAKQVLLMQVPRGPYHVTVPGVPRSVAEGLLDPKGGRSSRNGLGASQLAAARNQGNSAAKNAAAVADAISRKNSLPQRKGGMTKAELRAHITCVVLRTCFGALEEFRRKYKNRLAWVNSNCCFTFDHDLNMVIPESSSSSNNNNGRGGAGGRVWREEQVFEDMHALPLAMQLNDGGKWWHRRVYPLSAADASATNDAVKKPEEEEEL